MDAEIELMKLMQSPPSTMDTESAEKWIAKMQSLLDRVRKDDKKRPGTKFRARNRAKREQRCHRKAQQ
jgi:hypothetical protein